MNNFSNWLMNQTCRDDDVGKLARAAMQDINWPSYNPFADSIVYIRYLMKQRLEPLEEQRRIEQFKKAWLEYCVPQTTTERQQNLVLSS
jgi:uncharacterized protein YozE (UPF0346 family)